MAAPAPTGKLETLLANTLFVALLATHAVLAAVGWTSGSLPGNEFRQVQTAIAAFFTVQEGISIAVPTPLLGPPWFVPMEFPLYQWIVAWLAQAAHWEIIPAGRAVSLGCFYATLPALALLLARAGLPAWQRRLSLGFVLATPVYIFYARGVTIEPLALLCSVWFLAALVEAVARDSRLWLAAAMLAGIAAGIVKVTTLLLFLVPVGVWLAWTALGALRTGTLWSASTWRRLAPVLAALLWPCLAAYGWVKFSDALKLDHPSIASLASATISAHNFATLDYRLSARFWRELAGMWTCSAASPLLFGLLGLAALWAGRWRAPALGCLALFFAAPLVFPILYSWHDYYFYANAVLLALAAGFVFAGLRAACRPPWPAWSLLVVTLAFQLTAYFQRSFPLQRAVGPGATSLAFALRDLTDPDDVLVIAGQDWHGAIPFYARRRALMLRRGEERDMALVEREFAHLRDSFVPILILHGGQRDNTALLERAVRLLNIDPHPLLRHQDSVVYAHRAVVDDYLGRLRVSTYSAIEVDSAPRTTGPVTAFTRSLRGSRLFGMLSPAPYRYAVPFGLGNFRVDGERWFAGHAPTALWFRPPPAARRLHVEFGLLDSATAGKHDPSDGIEFAVLALDPRRTERPLYSRMLDPRHRAEDRGRQTLDLPLDLPLGTEIVLRINPGPAGNEAFDWGYLRSVRFD